MGYKMAERRSLGYSDPRWKALRETVLGYAGYRCECCGTKDKKLHAHHTFYLAGHEVWEYDDHHLCCLCEDCHNEWHNANDDLKRSMAWMREPEHLQNMLALQFAYRKFIKYQDQRNKPWYTIADMVKIVNESFERPRKLRKMGSVSISEDLNSDDRSDDDE